ncbi:uncharacterized protein LOC132948692 [Metopolophium dirhodum]|uniref:uncharacterized protein LOC132948692 n=1 Tax=Metopolophium dirhodum TaxID=44670 RepID=UPI00298FAD7E|nr:uncharacterized protein LOC132948692 [Metopolophium dirhodum]
MDVTAADYIDVGDGYFARHRACSRVSAHHVVVEQRVDIHIQVSLNRFRAVERKTGHEFYKFINMVQCWVPLCSHISNREDCKFFRFPANDALRNNWAKAVRRSDAIPTKNTKICNCHFKEGLKINGPSIFSWNKNSHFNFASPEKCTKYASGPMGRQKVLVETENDIDNGESMNTKLNCEIETVSMPNEEEASKSNGKMFDFYCGISKFMFDLIIELVSKVEINYYYTWSVKKLCLNDQVLMTLMKLRLNLCYTDLAFRFGISESTVGNIIITFISVLHEILFVSLMSKVPSQNKNQNCLPNCFNDFKNCRITLDCTEISCDIPNSLVDQKLTYSSYKHRNTLKGLVGVAPNGVITYASKLYPGSTSDKKIVSHCGVLEILQPGDLVLADKGFLISDILPHGTSLNIPPFLMTPQFTPSEVIRTKNIARARIHVERVMASSLKTFKATKDLGVQTIRIVDVVFVIYICA